MKRHLGFLLFDNVTTMDITGPLEAFHSVNDLTHAGYQFHFIGVKPGAVVAESGLKLHADTTLYDAPLLDTLIVPGGRGARAQIIQNEVCPWLAQIKPLTRRIVSVCTGAFLLGKANLLNGKKASTHWAYIDELQALFPNCKVQRDAVYCHEGDIATSAGISAGIDLSLKLIEDDLGAQVAADVARYLVVHFRRSGNQAQYSKPLQHQAQGQSKFASLIGWMMDNIDQELSIAALAEHCSMSERNFCRRFTQTMGVPPGRFVEQLRLDFVRQMLTDSKMPLSVIATATGFNSNDVLRRAFERRYGTSPLAYRQNFSVV